MGEQLVRPSSSLHLTAYECLREDSIGYKINKEVSQDKQAQELTDGVGCKRFLNSFYLRM